MTFIDASFYLAILNSQDSLHQRALAVAERVDSGWNVTTQATLGEVATVGAMRYHKAHTISFIEAIYSLENTNVLLEQETDVSEAWTVFKQVASKNISWVDCYNLAVARRLQADHFLTFDKQLLSLWEQG